MKLSLNPYDLETYLHETFHEYAAETRDTVRYRLMHNGTGYLRVLMGSVVIYQGKNAQYAINRFHGLSANYEQVCKEE